MPDNLQFDHAEPASGAQTGSIACSVCSSPLPDTYFVANGQIVCERCRRGVEAEWNRGGAAGRMSKAVALGVLAMVGCAVLWYIVLKLTDSQWGILAIVVGLVVGGAVRKGSNGRGGWRYQALAIFLTYTAIVSSYVPYIIEAVRERGTETASLDSAATIDLVKDAGTNTSDPGPLAKAFATVLLLGLLFALPFLAGIENVIGILIIGFALYEAWKLNRRVELTVTGPHQVAATGAHA
jgi:hypothetical protein